MERPEQNLPSPERDRLLHALDELKRAAEILRTMGFDVTDRLINEQILVQNTARNTAFPIVSDGGDGIRACYDKHSGELIISFTNSFEDWDNPKRVEVMDKISKELGWEKTRVIVKKKVE